MAGRFHLCLPIIQVADVKRSLGFYRNQLGFEVTYSFPSEDDPQVILLAIAGTQLGLAGMIQSTGNPSTAIWLYTDDVDAAVAALREAGVRILAEPTDQSWGERVALAADPDGYLIHIGAPS